MISLEKLKILTPLQELSKNVEDLGKLIVATGFKKLPEVQQIVQSGHTGSFTHEYAAASWTRSYKRDLTQSVTFKGHGFSIKVA